MPRDHTNSPAFQLAVKFVRDESAAVRAGDRDALRIASASASRQIAAWARMAGVNLLDAIKLVTDAAHETRS